MKRIVVEKSKNRNEREGRRERNTADSLRSYIEERRRKKCISEQAKKTGPWVHLEKYDKKEKEIEMEMDVLLTLQKKIEI